MEQGGGDSYLVRWCGLFGGEQAATRRVWVGSRLCLAWAGILVGHVGGWSDEILDKSGARDRG